MLLEFSVANFRSFWQTQALQMTAGPGRELRESNCFSSQVPGVPNLLRSVVLYGPNAGGKSNLIRAMDFMKQFVLGSAKEGQEGEPIPVQPFLFHPEASSRASEVQVLVIQDGVRYQYGFAATRERVTAEWLLAFPGGRPQRWLDRRYDPATGKESWHLGNKLTGPKRLWQEATRPNALFLSTAVQLNALALKPLFHWFRELAVIPHGVLVDPVFSIEQCQDEAIRQRVVAFLNAADLSIADVRLEKRPFSPEDLPADLPADLREQVRQELEGKKLVRVQLLHPVPGGHGTVSLPLGEESDGTRKLFAYAGPWLDILASGRIAFVDELDNSLHPAIVRFLLRRLHDPAAGSQGGQVIFSSHDTSILDPEVLRRDQIWFVERDAASASCLRPLSDFSPRKGEALQKGYLRGRYGGLPYLSEIPA
ncbi:MAG: ATP-binding protein [Thermodesulfobacteriota bacterium]